MNFEMYMTYTLDETMVPGGPMGFKMQAAGNYYSYDFGLKISLPDVSDAITQQEFLEQQLMLMPQMEIPVELPAE